MYEDSSFFASLPTLLFPFENFQMILGILVDVKSCFIVVLTCTYLMTNDHGLIGLLWRNVYSVLFLFINWLLVFLFKLYE